MKKVGDLLINKDIDKIKQESVYQLSKEKHIIEFLKMHHLDASMIYQYWVEFLDYNDDYYQCIKCKGIHQCVKDNIGLKKCLHYLDGKIDLEMMTCQYGKMIERKREIFNQYIIKNVSDELLYTDMKSLDLIKNLSKQSVNTQSVIGQLITHITNNINTGIFLQGGMNSDKTKLFAAMALEYAKKGKTIGFIHFPTYLLDLKSSFQSGDSEYAIDKLMKVDCLFIDSIGEENVTPWSRDEVVLTILSYRTLNNLPTFFTSIYSFNELEDIYVLRKSDKADKLRAKTLIQKIKSSNMTLMID